MDKEQIIAELKELQAFCKERKIENDIVRDKTDNPDMGIYCLAASVTFDICNTRLTNLIKRIENEA